ncbi:DUF3427 domain-containing protein [Photobacterium damselae]|uniref:DUF3427 domain-containing protein n=1 Tax=Photobacterium damselae TaxID=38293 RepID=UPI0035A8683F
MAELKSKSDITIPLSDKSGLIQGLRTVAQPLSKECIFSAAKKYDAAMGKIDSFKDSTDYDVIVNEKRYPPKAILGIALSNYYDVPILSSYFKGGDKSECFRILNYLGFETVEKNKDNGNSKRENETFEYTHFVVGESQTKLEIFERGNVWVPRQGRDISGVTRFKNCVVLFVTLEKGSKDSEHKYNDKFLLNGDMFQWESQNSNTPATPHMKMIIDREPVILFVRLFEKIKGKSQPFLYIGELSYLRHSYPIDDKDTPVEVIFEVKNQQNSVSEELLALYQWSPGTTKIDDNLKNISATKLMESPIPKALNKMPTKTRKSSRKSKVNWAERDEHNRNLGLAGERLVVQYEKKHLININRPDLAEKVEHTALDDDYAGYDVVSFDDDGREKYIEVKTTKQSANTAFFISRNEVQVSRDKGNQYWLYRVYHFNSETGIAKFYSVNGPIDNMFDLQPENFKAAPKS